MEKLNEWTIPSEKEKILKSLIGHKIIDLIKKSYETFDEHLAYLDDVGISNYRDKLSFFKFSYGCLLIVFDNGLKCHFGSAEDLNSVIMFVEDIQNISEIDAVELTYIKSIDSNPFLELLNKKIVEINILSRKGLNSKQKGIPSETGVEFVFKDNKKLILSHNLTDDNFVFSVLTKDDKITDEIIKLKF